MVAPDPTVKQLLALPIGERARLAKALLERLDEGPPDPDAEASWDAEIERRVRSIEDGTAKLLDANEVIRRVRAKVKRMRRKSGAGSERRLRDG